MVKRILDMPDNIRRIWFAFLTIQHINQFILSTKRSAWIYVRPVKMYMRMSCRSFGTDLSFLTLDLAAVEVEDAYRGRGFFTVLITLLENQARFRRFDAVMVECIHEERLHAFLIKRGYEVDPFDAITLFRRIRQ